VTDLPQHPDRNGRLVDANLHLLDRQVLDRDDRPILAAGDLELEQSDEGRWHIVRVILGSGLTARFFGAHRPASTRDTLDWDIITDLGAAISTDVDRDDVDALWTERWWRDHVIVKIPGGQHDPG